MADYTYEDLKGKTLAELREIAAGIEHEAVQGYTQLNKDHLLPAICKALGIDTHEHHHVVGLDKMAVKARIRELKKQRDAILASQDRSGLKPILRQIHALKRDMRRATV
ncbi:hypothetical protein SVA_1000 [Sulfurifustis variabilis]|uniref:Rho termination factor N-terminal domain-containing protein n=1 Tax=Sulfurifustis variabilis TaxID=1675686 RepID=A0A1B4V243_9GAMM|nr:hypothetical protein [Sulfurifustis variabilis]BAU47579.1 hypothetical protein SVA_1000 [Sulfurifustis variabilis]